MVIETASERILRILVLAVGLGSIVFALLGLGEIIAQHPMIDPIFSVAVYVIYLGLPPVLATVSARLPVMALRIGLGLHAASAIVFIALWYIALDDAAIPTADRPWIFFTVTVATCTAALALPFVPAITYTLIIAMLCGTLRYAVSGGGDASAAVQDAIFIVLFSVVLVTLLQLALRSGRLQDAALKDAQTEAASSSATETFERQRVRYQEFTRDDVLATFAAVLREGANPLPQTRLAARQALGKLDELQGDSISPAFLGAAEFEALLRAATQGEIPLGVTTIDPPDDRVLIPVAVGDSLAQALEEAVRNSLAHAGRTDGRPVLRQALVTISPSHVSITVSDDGRGFTSGRIAPDRLGVRVSILQGVNSLPGGRAQVESSKNSGTTVTLDWRKDASAT